MCECLIGLIVFFVGNVGPVGGPVSSPVSSVSNSNVDASLASLPEHPHQQTIKIITYYQDIFDIPSNDDITKLTNFAFTGDVSYDKQRGFEHFAELTILAGIHTTNEN